MMIIDSSQTAIITAKSNTNNPNNNASPSQNQPQQQLHSLAKNMSASKSVTNMRFQRTKSLVELRKSKQNEKLMEKRNHNTSLNSADTFEASQCEKDLNLIKYKAKCTSSNSAEVLEGIECVRKSISGNTSTSNVQRVIDHGFLDIIHKLLDLKNDPNIVYNALWTLTNISSGSHEQCSMIVQHGLVEKIVAMLSSEHCHIVDQAIWTASNMAGDCPEFRNMIIAFDQLPNALNAQIDRSLNSEKYIKNIPWFISNLTRYKSPIPSCEQIKPLIVLLKRIIDLKSPSTNLDSLWTFCYISQHSGEHIQIMVDLELHKFLFSMIQNTSIEILKPAVRCIGNFAFSTDEHAQILIDNNIADYFVQFLKSNDPVIIKDTLWIISNLAAGPQRHADHVFKPEMISVYCLPLFDYVRDNFKITFELVHLVYNFLNSHLCLEALKLFSTENVIEKLSFNLLSNDIEMLLVTMKTLHSLFAMSAMAGERLQERLILCFESHDGLNRIEELQGHPNEKVYQASFSLISEFLSSEPMFGVENEADGNCTNDAAAATVDGPKFDF